MEQMMGLLHANRHMSEFVICREPHIIIISIIYPLTERVVGVATSFLHVSLFSTALWDLANSRPVHSLTLSSHLFLCLPCPLPPFTVPC